MRTFYSDRFVLPLDAGHRFPMAKYRLLRERLVAEGVVEDAELRVPVAATDTQILRVHDREYLERVVSGRLSVQEIRRLGFPWSTELVERSRRSVGGTIAAARACLTDGVAVNLAGGTHHARAERGSGFCVLNDVAIAARELQSLGLVDRVLVVDCDVHQGDGTARIFRDDPSVFTLSIHGRNNFPYRKEPGDLDLALEDGTGDRVYLERLRPALAEALARGRPQLAFYIAGADPYERDRWGRLALTLDGLAARDEAVFAALGERRIPVAVVMGGGYAPDVTEIVAIHSQTVRLARVLSRTPGHAETASSDRRRHARP